MSGHSKWATIKHKKGAADKKRGKLFAKLIKQVEVAARQGGGDVDANPTLRTMYQKARDASVPLDTIDRAVKRGTGELEGVAYEAVSYEGYAPAGIALIVEALTDNRNRTGSEVRSLFVKNGGSLAEPGAVADRDFAWRQRPEIRSADMHSAGRTLTFFTATTASASAGSTSIASILTGMKHDWEDVSVSVARLRRNGRSMAQSDLRISKLEIRDRCPARRHLCPIWKPSAVRTFCQHFEPRWHTTPEIRLCCRETDTLSTSRLNRPSAISTIHAGKAKLGNTTRFTTVRTEVAVMC